MKSEKTRQPATIKQCDRGLPVHVSRKLPSKVESQGGQSENEEWKNKAGQGEWGGGQDVVEVDNGKNGKNSQEDQIGEEEKVERNG
mgnify:CR=1 FL=1